MKYLLLIFIIALSFNSIAQTDTLASDTSKFRYWFFDEEDGNPDMSNFLLTKAGFLPVPILITNPAVGYGGMLAATFFHESMGESDGFPTISGAIGGGTQNGSWGAGIFHLQSLWDNRVRYSGFAGYGDINMRFYGLGYTDYFQNNTHNLFTNLYMTSHKMVGQIGESNLYIGGQYRLMANTMSISPGPDFFPDFPIDFPEDLLTKDYLISELSLVTTYDTRNNFFSPSDGILAEAKYSYSDKWLGASDSYSLFNSFFIGFTPLPISKLTGGLKAEYNAAFDGTPFFMQPYVSNRGVAMIRFQDKRTVEFEGELSLAINPRWDVLGFVGVGDAYGTNSTIFEDDISVSGGGGVRYLLARKFGIKCGIDVAYSEEPSFQLIVGSAWLRE